MFDSHGRKIDYMRISITDRCNLRCRYCTPEDISSIGHCEILRFEEILEICKQAVKLGIKKFKVTGGEPLVRKGCLSFLRSLKSIPGVEQVTITTNGVTLKDCIDELEEIAPVIAIQGNMDRVAGLKLPNAKVIEAPEEEKVVDGGPISGLFTKGNDTLEITLGEFFSTPEFDALEQEIK